jgi:hypothetical protein
VVARFFLIFLVLSGVLQADDLRLEGVSNKKSKSIQLAQEESIKKSRALTPEEFQEVFKKVMEQDLLKAKVSSVIVSSLFSQDPNIALLTGTNALDNNCWHLLLPAVTGALRISAILEI